MIQYTYITQGIYDIMQEHYAQAKFRAKQAPCYCIIYFVTDFKKVQYWDFRTSGNTLGLQP